MSDGSVAGPVVLDEHGDVGVYPDADACCAQVKAIDVRNGEYEAFDSQGRPLEFLVDGWQVSLRLAPSRTPDPHAVAGRVRSLAGAIGALRLGGIDIEATPLEGLIAAVLAAEPRSFTRRSLLPRRRRRRP